jgi:hypothetical protein
MHLGKSGFEQLVSIRASMNLGLTEVLKNGFPNVKAVKRPTIIEGQIEQAQWIAGFATGEGCFSINISKISTKKSKPCVNLHFRLFQHARDEQLMKRCVEFFQCVRVYKNRTCYSFTISKFGDLFTKFLPIFNEAPVMGNKAKDYKD